MIAGFFLGMTCVFILLTVTSLVERRLCAKWSLSYFRSGFPAFRQLRRASGLPSIAIDVEKLESLIPDSEHGRLEFRKVENGLFLFREACIRSRTPGYAGIGWYQPVMHGNLIIDPEKARIEVIGRLNWSSLLIGLAYVVFLISWAVIDRSTDFLLAVFAVVALACVAAWVASYVAQKKRLAQLADIAAEHASALS